MIDSCHKHWNCPAIFLTDNRLIKYKSNTFASFQAIPKWFVQCPFFPLVAKASVVPILLDISFIIQITISLLETLYFFTTVLSIPIINNTDVFIFFCLPASQHLLSIVATLRSTVVLLFGFSEK